MDNGRPCPSVSTLRFTPPLPRSVGLGPVVSPAQGSLGHAVVQCQPLPVNALQFLAFQQAAPPECLEYTCINPFPEAAIRRRAGADSGAVQRIPLHACSPHQKDYVNRSAVRHSRPVASQWMLLRQRQERLHLLPQRIGHSPALATLRLTHDHYLQAQNDSAWTAAHVHNSGTDLSK